MLGRKFLGLVSEEFLKIHEFATVIFAALEACGAEV